MKYSIGDVVYSSVSNKHALITDYVPNDEPPDLGALIYQLLCLEDGEYYLDRKNNTDRYCVKVA
jgi:hypothetical protein